MHGVEVVEVVGKMPRYDALLRPPEKQGTNGIGDTAFIAVERCDPRRNVGIFAGPPTRFRDCDTLFFFIHKNKIGLELYNVKPHV